MRAWSNARTCDVVCSMCSFNNQIFITRITHAVCLYSSVAQVESTVVLRLNIHNSINPHLFTPLVNPRRACAARVTVLDLCVCVCVTQHLTLNVIIRTTNDSNFPSGGWRLKILSDFLWKCFVAKLERFLLVRLRASRPFFTSRKTRMGMMNLDHADSVLTWERRSLA